MTQATIGELIRRERLLAEMTQVQLSERIGYDRSHLSRIESGKVIPVHALVESVCRALALDETAVSVMQAALTAVSDPTASSPNPRPAVDWGRAPEVTVFYGRSSDQEQLSRHLSDPNCRLITVMGLGGIGKSSLAVQLAKSHQTEFEALIWRSLKNVPPLRETLINLLTFLSDQHAENLSESSADLVRQLIVFLRHKRCLLILDNFESVLDADDDEARAYRQLVEQLGRSQHQSLILLTSRQKPAVVARLEGESDRVVVHRLGGLDGAASQELLRHKGLPSAPETAQQLAERCSGHPLALEISADIIREVYSGDIAAFLADEQVVFGEIETILQQQFQRLSPLAQQVMVWLAIKRGAVSRAELRRLLTGQTSARRLTLALNELLQRSMVERAQHLASGETAVFQLQNVVLEFMTERLIGVVARELQSGWLDWIGRFPLLEAEAPSYIQQAQRRFIVTPLLQELGYEWGEKTGVATRLKALLPTLRRAPSLSNSYAAGNLLDLLLTLSSDLSHSNFSQLTIRQANLQAATLQGVDFSGATFEQCGFAAPFGHILAIVFTPDGQRFATATTAGGIHWWSASDGQPLGMWLASKDWVRAIALAPDGATLLAATQEAAPILQQWALDRGKTAVCQHTLRGHQRQIRAVAISPDGQLMASGSEDETIRLWASKSVVEQGVLRGHEGAIWEVAFAPQPLLGAKRPLASAGTDHTIRLWDSDNGTSLTTLTGHENWVTSLAFAPDGQLLASGSHDATVRLWTLGEDVQLYKTLQTHAGWVRTVAFSPDGQLLACGSEQFIYLWDVALGELRDVLQGHERMIEAIAFAPDGHLLVSGGADQTIRLWDVATGDCLTTLMGYRNPMWTAVFHPQSGRLATGSSDGKVRVWAPDKAKVSQTLHAHSDWAKTLAYSPDGRLLASGSSDKAVCLWEAATGQPVTTLLGHGAWVSSVAFHPDGHLLASGSGDKTVRLWRTAVSPTAPDYAVSTLTGHRSRVWSVAFCSQTKLLASSDDGGSILVWDCARRQQVAMLSGHLSSVYTIACFAENHPLAGHLVSGGNDGTLRLWDTVAGKQVRVFAETGVVWHIATHPTESVVALSLDNHLVKLLDVATGETRQTLVGHEKPVWWSQFSPDGQQLASCGDDSACRLWEWATGNCQNILRADQPYEGMKLAGVTGLTPLQKASLQELGAVD